MRWHCRELTAACPLQGLVRWCRISIGIVCGATPHPQSTSNRLSHGQQQDLGERRCSISTGRSGGSCRPPAGAIWRSRDSGVANNQAPTQTKDLTNQSPGFSMNERGKNPSRMHIHHSPPAQSQIRAPGLAIYTSQRDSPERIMQNWTTHMDELGQVEIPKECVGISLRCGGINDPPRVVYKLGISRSSFRLTPHEGNDHTEIDPKWELLNDPRQSLLLRCLDNALLGACCA